jgi:integrase
MGRTVNRLSALSAARIARPGMHADGQGLYLQVTKSGAKSWIYRFMLRGKAREMGLGSLSLVSLSEARLKANDCRRLRQEGIDPIEAKRKAQEQARLDAAMAITFADAAASYIAGHRAAWRNGKHASQWTSTLATYADPIFGSIPIQLIDTAMVLKAIEPIWAEKPETAGRVRGRIEAVLDWATARGYRQGENPARWRGHLDKLLPARSRLHAVKHHSALPFDELSRFLALLRKQRSVAARALEFTILTAARTGETIGATWSEIDAKNQTWLIPAARMKSGKAHRIPLSARAFSILKQMQRHRESDGSFLFPGGKSGRPLSNMSMLALLRRMGRDDLTVHGFRSTFRDWAAECTAFPNEVVEMALAHAVGNKVEAAYRRGDLFDKRRRLMDQWAAFCLDDKSSQKRRQRVGRNDPAKNVHTNLAVI